MKNRHIYKLIGISIVFSLCSTCSVEASSVQMISVSSNTGGNTSENGVVIEGNSRSSVDIVTKINGETIEEIHETSSNGSIHIESNVISNNDESVSETHVYKDGHEVEADTVRLENDETPEHLATNIISSLNTESIEETEGEFMQTYSLLKTLFINFSRTINHVLSNLI